MLLSDRKAAREEALEMGLFPTRILLATDGSEEAELAALKAVALAQSTDSELHVVHVGVVPLLLLSDPGTLGDDGKLYDEVEEESRELLRKESWRMKVTGGIVAGTHLRMGEVVDLEIVALAKELRADLIVMGCRGHRGIRRAIEGSISDAVIRHAPCPVLVVRSHESAQDPKWPALTAGGR
jgi:nucleotide-binding universal stress UspA family protein